MCRFYAAIRVLGLREHAAHTAPPTHFTLAFCVASHGLSMSSLVPPFLWRSPFKLKSDLEVEHHSGFNMIQQSFRNFWFLDPSHPLHFSLDDSPYSPAQNAWLRAPRCDMDGHGLGFVFCAHFLVGWVECG